MIAKPKLCKTAAQEIAELRRDWLIEPTIEEIMWLDKLGRAVEHPTAGERLAQMDRPVKVGNVYLWPFTAGSSAWWQEYGLPWFDKTRGSIRYYALAFCLAHGRGLQTPIVTAKGFVKHVISDLLSVPERRTLADLIDFQEAKAAVKHWSRRLTCGHKELNAAIEEVLPPVFVPEEEKKTPEERAEEETELPQGIDWHTIVNELASITGTDPEYWLWRTSKDACAQSYMKAVAHDAAMAGSPGASRLSDPVGEAVKDMTKARVQIIKDHGGNPNQMPDKKA